MICHGKGDPTNDGCCFVGGEVCPLRWKIDGGRVVDHQGTDLGTVDELVKARFRSKTARDEATAQVVGVRIVCRAALEVLANNPALVNDRAGFDAAWDAHPDYVAQVRPHWSQIESQNGMVPGSYQCSTWGPGAGQCCFGEDQATNDSRASVLSARAVTVRIARRA